MARKMTMKNMTSRVRRLSRIEADICTHIGTYICVSGEESGTTALRAAPQHARHTVCTARWSKLRQSERFS
jgi:hypothetical protein